MTSQGMTSATHTKTPLDVARTYANAGVPVFPCHETASEEVDPSTGEFVTRPEKSPKTTNGLKGASKSARIVDIFFRDKYPTSAIGVPTGEPLGAWVLDLDKHGDRDGHTWLAEMEAKHGPLPDTARASTANGGTHVFFRHVDGVRNRAAIAPGVDTRGDGGYILAPGSNMADGRAYKWHDHDGHGLPEFAEAPAWLLDMVIARQAQPADTPAQPYVYTPNNETGVNAAYVDRAVEDECSKVATAREGNRGTQLNTSAFSLGTLVGAGILSRSDAEEQLYAAAVASGVAKKDGAKSTRDRIKRGLDSGIKQPRQVPQSTNDNVPSSDPADMVARADAKKAAKSEERIQTSDTNGGADSNADTVNMQPTVKKRERFEKTWFDEIEEGAPKETIVKGALGAGEFTTISGLPGTGKSVIVTDMACHVAAGMEWHGRRVKKGLVIYVAAERKKLTERRMMAFRKHYSVKDVPLLVIGGRLDFTSNLKDAKELIAAIREAELITGMQCVWVIIDTLTRVFGAGDQNASKDMTRFVQSCDEILSETKAHVTAIHHSAWSGERGKGAIDLDGAVDASFMVKKDHGKYRLVCDGTNDGDEGDVLVFTMESVPIGIDEDGEPTTAPVVVKKEPDTVPTSGTLKGYKGDVLAALVVAIEKDGIEPEGDAFPEDIIVVDMETWKKHFYATRDMDSVSVAATTKKQFQRAPEELVGKGMVNNIGLWYWAA